MCVCVGGGGGGVKPGGDCDLDRPSQVFFRIRIRIFYCPRTSLQEICLTVHSRKQNKQQNYILTRQQRLKIYQTHTTYYYHSIEKINVCTNMHRCFGVDFV